VPDDHPDYRECTDQDCPRFPCRVYREGYADGYGDGQAAGYAAGAADGYAAGAAAVSTGR
jgi:hypothetical protein